MSSKVSGLTLSLFISIILILVLLFILSGILLPWSVVRAQVSVIRVTQTGATSGSCGTSWASPCDLQYALSTLAVSGTEIWVEAGLYKPTTVSTNVSATFALTSGVALYGGFAGTESSRDQRDWTNNVTVLSGDIDNNDVTDSHGILTTTANITGTNAYHVVAGSNTDLTAILDGFTISGGNANGSDLNDRGGGLYSISGSPTIRNVIFSGNAATNLGGGVFNSLSTSTITNVVFIGNSAGFGGGLYNSFSNPILASITFSGNLASPHSGGGMYDHTSNPTLTKVTFIGNSASIAGGGMANNGSNPLVTYVTFSGNFALLGGGMFNVSSSKPTLMNVTFSGNSASYSGGGGMYNLTTSPVLTNVIFISNTTTGGGGGMANETGNPNLTNVTFSGNSANSGGGIDSSSSSSPVIRNTILWGNTATTGSQLNNDGTSSSTIADSVVQGGYLSGTNIITTNPRLGPFADHGGGTSTIALLPGSSAIDAANDANCPASDQRGVGRPQGTHCDIGAFESQRYTLSIIGGDNQSAQINTAFPNALVVAVTSAFSEPVDGGQIIFTAPASGASAALTDSPATISGGAAGVTALANSTAGSYSVTVGAAGVITPVNFSLTNKKKGTTTTLTSSANPSTFGQLLTLTATVTSAVGLPTGNVAFYDSGTLLGTGTIDASGQVTYSTSTLLVGTHSITATYGGNSDFSPSTSSLLNQVVLDTPIRNLSAINDSPTTLGRVTIFTATATSSNIVYTWNFGDNAPTAVGTFVTHTYSFTGYYIATVTATNSISTVVTTTPVTITNLAPIANAGTHQTVLVNSLVTLDGSGSFDPDGHVPLTYGWTQSDGPEVVLSNYAISMPTFTAPSAASVLTFTLVVTDARGLTSTPSQVMVNIVPYRVYIPLILKNM